MAGGNLQQVGPIEFFDGAMASPVVRKTKVIRVVENAVFSELVMQFPTTPATSGAADPANITFPAMFEIWDVASFELASGSIQVVYHT